MEQSKYIYTTNEMISLFKSGKTLKEIGQIFGISKQAVNQRLRKAGYNAKLEKSYLTNAAREKAIQANLLAYIEARNKLIDTQRNSIMWYKDTIKKKNKEIQELKKELAKLKESEE